MHRISHILNLAKRSGREGVSLRNRLLAYLFLMSLAVLAVTITILIATGVIFNGKDQVNERLNVQLDYASSTLQENVDLLNGYNRSMAQNLSHEIDYFLDGKTDIESLNNHTEDLIELQKVLYGEISTTLKLARCSGCFAVLNATTNTNIENADNFRSGVYLRLGNVNNTVQLNPDVYLFRGIPEIAIEKGLELHSRWNLEFDITNIPTFDEFVKLKTAKQGVWSHKIHVTNTWEEMVMYSEPIIGKQGQIYGVCGVDLSELYMQLSYPVVDTEFGPIISVMAPMENNVLVTEEGLIGGHGGTWMTHFPALEVKEKNGFTLYQDGAESYVGCHKVLSMPGAEDKQWVCAVLTPMDTYRDYVDAVRQRLAIFGLLLAVALVLLSLGISKRYVDPIVASLESLQNAEDLGSMNTGISELDTLLRYFDSISKVETKTIVEEGLPANIEELFTHFSNGVEQLTNAEYHVFRLYMDGMTIAEVPEAACISMSTVKKHNRNIYDKLHISSYDELMLYLDLFRRCDRLGELER